MWDEKGWVFTYRLHKLKHLPLLDLLHLEDILQGDLVEMLPNQVHLAVCLQAPGDERGNTRSAWLGAASPMAQGQQGLTGVRPCGMLTQLQTSVWGWTDGTVIK